MAKRKAAGSKKKAARKAVKKTARKAARKTARPAARAAAKKRTAKKTARKAAKSTARRKSAPTKRGAARKTTSKARKASAPKPAARKASARKTATPATVRKAPSLNRARRTIADEDDLVPTPPSSLDLDRTASAVRSGRRSVQQRLAEHTETSPAMTAGDVDADWESAYSVGDEAPGGDNPTPDQDIVDDIGRAVGVEYQDNEELKGEEKITKRDSHRWELDPASSEDWDDRD